MNENLQHLSDALQEAISIYNEKPTKAVSKRIRLILGDIKHHTPAFRAELVELDKSGEY